MRPPSPPQLSIFEPNDALAASATQSIALPFQPRQEIDVRRAAKILGVNRLTVQRMCKRRLFGNFRLTPKSPLRIYYDSLVEYCDSLRTHYGISTARVPLPKGRTRRRDEDLLPFPPEQKMTVRQATQRLNCSPQVVHFLIEDGTLAAYQVMLGAEGCPWRIYKPSFEAYIASLHEQARVATKPATPERGCASAR